MITLLGCVQMWFQFIFSFFPFFLVFFSLSVLFRLSFGFWFRVWCVVSELCDLQIDTRSCSSRLSGDDESGY